VNRTHVHPTSGPAKISDPVAAWKTEQGRPPSGVRSHAKRGFRADFSRVPIHAVRDGSPSTLELLTRAAAEPARPLSAPLQETLKDRLSTDFSSVRIHSGTASAEAAERLGARAFTLGHRVHLGAGTDALPSNERDRLLAHESVHAAQQRFHRVQPDGGLRVGRTDSAAEVEARAVAAELGSRAPSRSLALRRSLRASPLTLTVPEPLIQRDLIGKHKAVDGEFNVNLKTQSNPGKKSGMSGTIKFKASEGAPDSASIRLLQIARTENLTTGKEVEWTGGEANRTNVMTKTDSGVSPGFFVDVLHKNRAPRSSATDPAVSPFYIDDYAALKDPNNTDGSKKGKAITEASLWDFPGANINVRFSFETTAMSASNRYPYASLIWGFTVSDAAKGTITNEHVNVADFPSGTFGAAVKAFNEFYKNPGSSTAPK
jgi:hypothetical protein